MPNRKKSSIEIYQDIPRRMKKLFGVSWVPTIPFDRTHWPEEVRKQAGKMSLSGVQQKASVLLNKKSKQIELAKGNGTYILKPDPPEYFELSVIENLCMDLAEELGMDVPPHGLLFLSDGTPAYIVKRFDRNPDGSKVHKEDMAQLLQFRTEDKYGGSLEKVGKEFFSIATNAHLDLLNFFERVVFSFMIGNGDMHLKNWAVLVIRGAGTPLNVQLAPCYDFVSSKLFIPNEEESALTINGKRNKLELSDFIALASHLGIDKRAMDNVFEKLLLSKRAMIQMVQTSTVSEEKKKQLEDLISARIQRLEFPQSSLLEPHKETTIPPGTELRSSKDADNVIWFSRQKSDALKQLKESGIPGGGSMIFTCSPESIPHPFSVEELSQASRDSQIQTFGWPIGIHLDTDEYRPRADTEGIKALVKTIRPEKESSFDTWFLRRDGHYFILTSLFEDQRSTNKIFLDTRIVRVTETLLHAVLLYERLGLDPKTAMTMRFDHEGLRNRELTFANAARIVSRVHTTGVDSVVTNLSVKLGEIKSNLNDLVFQVISDLTEMFDFFKPSKVKTVDPIVNDFINGRIG